MNNLPSIVTAYYKLLCMIDWDDEVLVDGLREGLNKFASNAYLGLSSQSKHRSGHYYSAVALLKVQNDDCRGLIFEHMVPKSKHIQKPCIKRAKVGLLTEAYVRDLFQRYWKIAIITREEDSLLESRSMPNNWDGEDIFVRYRAANINLVPSPFIIESRADISAYA
jgi:hypothetical protein